MAKKLIITADDLGLTGRVNEAIAFAYRKGIVTTASLMVNGAAFDSAADFARREPDLDVGLHLNLTEGHPVALASRVASIADARGFIYRHPLKLATALYRNRVRLDDLEREIRAQIEKALDSDLQITHVDGHKHVHAIPVVLRTLCRVAPEYGIHALRSTREKIPQFILLLARSNRSRRQIVKQAVFGKILSTAWIASRPLAVNPAILSPQRFYGITQTGFLDTRAFADVVHDLNPGIHELMCHPGYVDDDLRNTPTRLLTQRERELDLLTSAEVRQIINQAGVTLTTYRELVENHGNRRPDPVLHRYSAL